MENSIEGRPRRMSARSRRREEADDNETGPLIHPDVIDEASQRVFIISFFILLQCWKIYDMLLIKSNVEGSILGYMPLNNLTFVLKYALVDGVFFWILPLLNIRYLVFSPLQTFLITVFMNLVTFLMASTISIPIFSGYLLPFWKVLSRRKELTFSGDSINVGEVLDMSSHFRGRYTIHYLPDSSAKFNPFGFQNMCVDLSSSDPLHIPIQFNTSSELGSLQLKHMTPNNEVNFINYTSYDLRRFAKRDLSHLKRYLKKEQDERIFYLEVPITAPGKYTISKVTDAKGTSIRTYKSEVFLPFCPSIQFTYPPSMKSHKGNYQCALPPDHGDESPISLPLIDAYGVMPIKAEIEFRVNGKTLKNFEIDLSDITTSENLNSNSSYDLRWMELKYLRRNALEQVILKNGILQKNQAGRLEFQLLKVTDSAGNVKQYNPSSRDKDVYYGIDMKSVPSIDLIDSNSNELLLVNGTKTLSVLLNVAIPKEDFPIKIGIIYEGKGLDDYFEKTFKDSAELFNGFTITQAGTYRIVNSSTKFCPATIGDRNTVDIRTAKVPLVDLRAEPIYDKCVGVTGYRFDFEFEGKPPFTLQYRVYEVTSTGIKRPVYNDRGLLASNIKVMNKNSHFEYHPPREGNFLIVFNNLRDAIYAKKPITLNETEYSYQTHFNQKSSVKVVNIPDTPQRFISACKNEPVEFPLQFEGHEPFSFKYEIVNVKSGSVLILDSKKGISKDYLIKTPQIKKGGEYILKLSDLKDGLGCDVECLDKNPLVIKAREAIASIDFGMQKDKNVVTIVEGDYYNIPLSTHNSIGKSLKDLVEYSITNLYNDSISRRVRQTDTDNLKAYEEGVYTLLSYSNDGCKGQVSSSKQVIIKYHDKPKLFIMPNMHEDTKYEMELGSVCQEARKSVDIEMVGVKPFVIEYNIQLPDGRLESRSMTLSDNKVTIELPTMLSGKYEHHFMNIYDKLYTKERLSRLRGDSYKPQSISYEVKPKPDIRFDRKDRFIQLCETALKQDSSKYHEIPIKLRGEYPFNLNASITDQKSGRTERIVVNNVLGPKLKLNEIYVPLRKVYLHEYLKTGDYLITFDELQDGNGCFKKGFSELESWVLLITEVPKITKTSATNEYCVGDHITYELSGISPFNVFYEFNGKYQKAELPHTFRRLATKPGDLYILALLDSSSNKCLVNYTQEPMIIDELKATVYDLPSVEINKGDYIVEDIHEGDQSEIIFLFTGTPPFKLTYTRTVPKSSKGKKKKGHREEVSVETRVIDNILTHEHSILTSLEGTYEAIEVRDAHCTARRPEKAIN